MSRSQRRAGNPVSLFPFLAVLLCTMGSLALLLLVTTHRIRHDAILWAESESLAQVEIEHGNRTVAVVEAEPKLPAPQVAPQQPPEKAEPAPPPVIDLNAQLERIVTGLVNRRDTRKQELRADFAALNAATRNIEQAAEQLTRVEGRLTQSRAEQRKHIAQVQTLGERHASVSGEVDQAEQRLRELRQQAASATTKYAFVPYDGASGTVRRPILIECTNKGMKFLPEGITLSAADLEGSSLESNPLLAGARSLVEFWATKGREPSDRKPYVLLVVRPSGSTAYYAARKLLSGLDGPSGYELLGETEELDLPKADPRAVETCRRAVDQALAERRAANSNERLVDRGRNWRGVLGGSRTSKGSEKTGSASAQDRKGEQIAGRAGESTGVAERSFLDGLKGENTGDSQKTLASKSADGTSENRTVGIAKPAFDEKLSATSNTKKVSSGHAPNCDVETNPGRMAANQPTSVARNSEGGPLGQSTTPQSADAGMLDSSNGTQNVSVSSSGAAAGQRTRTPAGSRTSISQKGDQKGMGGAGNSSEIFPTFGATANGASGQGGQNDPFSERRWGIHGPRAHIGFERRVVIYIDTHQLVVGNENPIPIGHGESREQLASNVLHAIESEVRAWGQPPEHFYWSPSPHFVVSPGGNQYYEPLKSQVAKWGLSSTVEFRLDPYKPTRGPE